MAKISKSRGAQYPLVSEFIANFNDTMADVNGVVKTFGSVFGDAGVFEIINIPEGAVLMGGEVIVETAGVGPTVYTAAIGVSGTPAALLAATDLKAAAGTRVALTGLGMTLVGGKNVILTIASTAANASAGKFRVRVLYTLDGRVMEVSPN